MMIGLDWTALHFTALDRTVMEWTGLHRTGLIWTVLYWSGVDVVEWSLVEWTALNRTDLDWIGLYWSGCSGVELSGVDCTEQDWSTLDCTSMECGLRCMVLRTAPSMFCNAIFLKPSCFFALTAVASHRIKDSACAIIGPSVSQIALVHTLSSKIFLKLEGEELSERYLQATFAADDTIDIPSRCSTCDCDCDSNEVWLIKDEPLKF